MKMPKGTFISTLTGVSVNAVRCASARALLPAIAMIGVICAALAVYPLPAQAQTDLAPRCSYKVNGGERVSELPPHLDSGSLLEIDCRLEGVSARALEVQTELDAPAWIVNRVSYGIENSITVEEFEGGIVELDGIVPNRRASIAVTEGDDPYYADAAPPTSLRIISFSGPGAVPRHIESRIEHPLSALVEERLLHFESNLTERQRATIEPITDKASALVDEGRPWAAIELLDASQPLLDEYLSNQGSSTGILVFGLFIGLLLGVVIGAVVGYFISRRVSN